MKRLFLTLLAATVCCGGLFAQDLDSLLGTMSRREKIAQLIFEAVESREDPALRARQEGWIREGLGGLIVMDDVLADNMQMINELQALARIPMLVSIDGEWGAAMRFYEYAAFPRAMQLGALPDASLVEEAGRVIGSELRDIKIFANYAPVVDVNNNPRNPVINTRSFGENPWKVAEWGAAYMRGMQSAGVFGAAKHFPGHGDTDVDSHKGLPVLLFDRARLDSLELVPFRRLIAEGVAMVMVGHLSIPALDSTGTPASLSKPIVTGLLRNELGFQGVIITDALGMEGVAAAGDDAALLAYEAGADILLMPRDTRHTIDALDALFRRGALDERDLDTRVRRVLSLKARAGMLSPNYSPFVDTTGIALRARAGMLAPGYSPSADTTGIALRAQSGMLAPGYSPSADTTGVALRARRPKSEVGIQEMHDRSSDIALQARRPNSEAVIQELCDRSMTVVQGRLRRPLRLHRHMALTTRPRVAYVAFNAATLESAEFEAELLRHGRVTRFDLPSDATPAQIDSVGELLRGYRDVIVGIHSGLPRPRSGGPQRFATIDPSQLSRIAAWSGKRSAIRHGRHPSVDNDNRSAEMTDQHPSADNDNRSANGPRRRGPGHRHRLHCVYFGNPYDLNRFIIPTDEINGDPHLRHARPAPSVIPGPDPESEKNSDPRHTRLDSSLIHFFKTFIIAYSDTRYNNIAAARALPEPASAQGSLPVAAGPFPSGHHSNHIH